MDKNIIEILDKITGVLTELNDRVSRVEEESEWMETNEVIYNIQYMINELKND